MCPLLFGRTSLQHEILPDLRDNVERLKSRLYSELEQRSPQQPQLVAPFVSCLTFLLLTLSLPRSKSAFSQPSKQKCVSVIVRIGSIIIFHLSKLWKVKFFILCDVILLVKLQGKFYLPPRLLESKRSQGKRRVVFVKIWTFFSKFKIPSYPNISDYWDNPGNLWCDSTRKLTEHYHPDRYLNNTSGSVWP